MISLLQLLNEVVSTPKAIFLAGAAGSGKSYMTQQLIPSNLVVINSDDTYEEMLKASGIGLKQKDFTPDQLSQAAKLQAQARKVTQDKLSQAISNAQDIVIDGTGAASNPILKKKQELEALGYTTFMLIHQVRSGLWGSFAEFQDEIQNLELIMRYIKQIYLEHTNIPESDLVEILKHDTYLNAEECIKYGLVDEIV